MLCDAQVHLLADDTDVAQERTGVGSHRVDVATGLGYLCNHADDRCEVGAWGCGSRQLADWFGAWSNGRPDAGFGDGCGYAGSAGCGDGRADGRTNTDRCTGSHTHGTGDARLACGCGGLGCRCLLGLLLVLVDDPRRQNVDGTGGPKELQLVDNIRCKVSKRLLIEDKSCAVTHKGKRCARHVRLVNNGRGAESRCHGLDDNHNLLLGS